MAVSEWRWDQANPSVIHNATETQDALFDAQTDYHYDANGNVVRALVYFHATQAQVEAAYAALTNRGQVANFNQRVWNDLMDKIAEIQLDWYMALARTTACTTSIQDSSYLDEWHKCAYVSDERELVVYSPSDPGRVVHTNVGRRLMAYKFMEAVKGFVVLSNTWTWIWETEGVTIEPGVPVKGSYILDLVRAINHWCGLTKMEFTGPAISIAELIIDTDIGFLEMLPFIYSGFFDTDVDASLNTADSLIFVYSDQIADLDIQTGFDFVDGLPFLCTMVFYLRDSIAPAMADSYQFGCEMSFATEIEVEVGFSNDMAFEVSITFPVEQEIIQFRLDDSEQTGITIDTETTEDVAIELWTSLDLAAEITVETDIDTNIIASDSLPISELNMLFTFIAECATIELQPAYHLPVATGNISTDSYADILFGSLEYVEAYSIIYMLANSTATAYEIRRMVAAGQIMFYNYATALFAEAEKLTASGNINFQNSVVANMFQAKVLRSNPELTVSSSAVASRWAAEKISASQSTIMMSSRASVWAQLIRNLAGNASNTVSSVATAVSQLADLLEASANFGTVSAADVLQYISDKMSGSGDILIQSTGSIIGQLARTLRASVQFGTQNTATVSSFGMTGVSGEQSFTLPTQATVQAGRQSSMHADGEVLTSENAEIVIFSGSSLYANGDAEITSDATVIPKSPQHIDGTDIIEFVAATELLQKRTQLLSSDNIINDPEAVAFITLNESIYAEGQGGITFSNTATLSCSSPDNTLAITLDPYLVSVLDPYDVDTLETNFII